MAAQRHEISLRVLKTFHEWALLSNCFMMNLKLQNAAQRRFVVECYVVNCFHALRDFLQRSLRFWIIHE